MVENVEVFELIECQPLGGCDLHSRAYTELSTADREDQLSLCRDKIVQCTTKKSTGESFSFLLAFLRANFSLEERQRVFSQVCDKVTADQYKTLEEKIISGNTTRERCDQLAQKIKGTFGCWPWDLVDVGELPPHFSKNLLQALSDLSKKGISKDNAKKNLKRAIEARISKSRAGNSKTRILMSVDVLTVQREFENSPEIDQQRRDQSTVPSTGYSEENSSLEDSGVGGKDRRQHESDFTSRSQTMDPRTSLRANIPPTDQPLTTQNTATQSSGQKRKRQDYGDDTTEREYPTSRLIDYSDKSSTGSSRSHTSPSSISHKHSLDHSSNFTYPQWPFFGAKRPQTGRPRPHSSPGNNLEEAPCPFPPIEPCKDDHPDVNPEYKKRTLDNRVFKMAEDQLDSWYRHNLQSLQEKCAVATTAQKEKEACSLEVVKCEENAKSSKKKLSKRQTARDSFHAKRQRFASAITNQLSADERINDCGESDGSSAEDEDGTDSFDTLCKDQMSRIEQARQDIVRQEENFLAKLNSACKDQEKTVDASTEELERAKIALADAENEASRTADAARFQEDAIRKELAVRKEAARAQLERVEGLQRDFDDLRRE